MESKNTLQISFQLTAQLFYSRTQQSMLQKKNFRLGITYRPSSVTLTEFQEIFDSPVPEYY